MTKDNQDDVDQVENALKYLKTGFQKGKKKSNVIKKKTTKFSEPHLEMSRKWTAESRTDGNQSDGEERNVACFQSFVDQKVLNLFLSSFVIIYLIFFLFNSNVLGYFEHRGQRLYMPHNTSVPVLHPFLSTDVSTALT